MTLDTRIVTNCTNRATINFLHELARKNIDEDLFEFVREFVEEREREYWDCDESQLDRVIHVLDETSYKENLLQLENDSLKEKIVALEQQLQDSTLTSDHQKQQLVEHATNLNLITQQLNKMQAWLLENLK